MCVNTVDFKIKSDKRSHLFITYLCTWTLLIYDYLFEILRLIILHTQKKISDLSEDIKYVFSLTRQKVSGIKVQF